MKKNSKSYGVLSLNGKKEVVECKVVEEPNSAELMINKFSKEDVKDGS